MALSPPLRAVSRARKVPSPSASTVWNTVIVSAVPAAGGVITVAGAESLMVLVGLPTSDAVTTTVLVSDVPAGGAVPVYTQGAENSPGSSVVPTRLGHTETVLPFVVSVTLSILI